MPDTRYGVSPLNTENYRLIKAPEAFIYNLGSNVRGDNSLSSDGHQHCPGKLAQTSWKQTEIFKVYYYNM